MGQTAADSWRSHRASACWAGGRAFTLANFSIRQRLARCTRTVVLIGRGGRSASARHRQCQSLRDQALRKRVDKLHLSGPHSRRSLQATAELGIDCTCPSSAAGLKAIVAAGFGDVPLIALRWRCSRCGSTRIDSGDVEEQCRGAVMKERRLVAATSLEGGGGQLPAGGRCITSSAAGGEGSGLSP
jgi:hypothetical protein